ncbi:hypothetical protein Tco_1048171 [Tanacetum coccineum]
MFTITEEPEVRLLLEEEFLLSCLNKYTFGESIGGFEITSINIVDPLNPANNLGRSVHKYGKFRQKFIGRKTNDWQGLKGDMNEMIRNVNGAEQIHLKTPSRSMLCLLTRSPLRSSQSFGFLPMNLEFNTGNCTSDISLLAKIIPIFSCLEANPLPKFPTFMHTSPEIVCWVEQVNYVYRGDFKTSVAFTKRIFVQTT